MAINRKCVVWFEGPKGVGKTHTVEVLARELEENHYNVQSVDLDVVNLEVGEGTPLQKIEARLAAYKFHDNENKLITLVDSTILSTLVGVYLNPYMQHTRDVELKSLFEYEAYLIPDSLVPTHIFLMLNPPFEKTQELWDRYKKEVDAYDQLFQRDFIREAFKNTNTTLIKLREIELEKRIVTIYDFLQQ